ncbi:GNAT family N-acetyltransferase [Micromonospora marina]|uniref:Protein N-acetyltransferase, RimJ/RimL family n=1 Tax=Micromonospora marina TaxID=307120 RepID=A0A1C4UC67_9ACTN|nr:MULTISPECIES: GNAT family N-acetyltransferase [Micromonospora]SCE69241.1 Protein N-acetyltransferase, RimJ/RimL family [Micromonospora marina]
MQLTCPPSIRDGDIVIRPHKPADLDAFARFLTDPDATRYMAFTPEQKSAEGARAMLDYVISSYGTEDEVLSLTIADASDDSYVGSVGAAPTEAPGVVEIYFTVLPGRQSRGVATRAATLLLDHLVAQPGVREIRADAVRDNHPSIRVLQKLGFQSVGRIDRQAAEGDLAHVAMSGVRQTLDPERWRAARRRSGG